MGIDIPDDLIEEINRKNCVAFVGAGLSRGAGLLGWGGLMEDMLDWATGHGVTLTPEAKDELKSLLDSGKYLLVAQEMRERMGNNDFREFMDATFRKPGLKPTKAHEILVQIPFASAITTNYDVLLESAYTVQKGIMPLTFTHTNNAQLAAALGEGSFYIFKAHGTIDDIETVILGRRDYQELLHNSAYRRHLETVFMTKAVLFLGYSLTDHDLMIMLDELSAIFKGYGVRRYALMEASGVSGIERERFRRDYNINIIPYESPGRDHREVSEFLAELLDRSKKPESLSSMQEVYEGDR